MEVRPPAVAGMFYDAKPDRLDADVRRYLAADAPDAAGAADRAAEPAFGAIVPHAGYVYSGPVAGAVYARLAIPSSVVILCPNHTGRGAPAALDPSDAWRTPLGDLPVDRRLADTILSLAPSLRPDTEAHRREHSLEVQLPFLQVLRPDTRFVPICLGRPDLAVCREVGEALATLREEEAEPPLLLASSDMNHYESRAVGRRKDDRALERVDGDRPGGALPRGAGGVDLHVRFPARHRPALRGARVGGEGGPRRGAPRQRRRDRRYQQRRGIRRSDRQLI